MAGEILINPENRWLSASGWADISHYGAPSDPEIAIGSAPWQAMLADAGHSASANVTPVASTYQPAAFHEMEGGGQPDSASFSVPLPTLVSLAPIVVPDVATVAGFNPSAHLVEDPIFNPNGSAEVPITANSDLAEAPTIAPSPASLLDIGPADPVTVVTGEIEGLVGADPTAGIATLVSLVSITDMLDFGAIDIPGIAALPSSGPSLLDALAGDPILVDPLLAETGEHDALPGNDGHLDVGGVEPAPVLPPLDSPLGDLHGLGLG